MRGLSKTRKRTLLVLGAAVAVSGATMACSALLGLEPPPGGATDTDGGDAPSTVDAAGCMTRYVSAVGGNDNNTGCTQDTPLKTIRAAVSAFDSEGLTGYAVEVCAGQYPETDLRMQSRGSLLGGYNCKTWARTGTYATDQVNESVITVAAPDSNHEVPLLIGAAIVDAGVMDAAVPEGGTPSLLVDGFSIVGPSGTPESYAVKVNPSATGVITNCRLFAGDATNLSAGVFVQTASPQIASNIIQSGTAALAVGVDVQTTGASAYIHNNVITSKDATVGATATGDGSFGVLVNGTGNNADANRIDENTVVSGNGILSAPIKIIGVSKGFVRRNRAQTLTATKAAGLGPMRGISLDASTNVQVLQNRVYSGGSNAGVGPLYGIFVYKGANVLVANNMVYGGFTKPLASGSDLNATGIALIGTKNPVAVYNTVFSGFSTGGPNSRAYDLAIATSSTDGVLTTNAVIQNNIFAGGGVNDFGLLVDNCTNGIDTFEHNTFFAQQTGLAFLGCTDASAPNRTVQEMAFLGRMGAKTLDNNVALRSLDTCGKTDDGGGCIVQDACVYYGTSTTGDGGQNLNGNQACVDSVFGSWSNADDGYSTLFAGGWALGATAPCAVTAGAVDLTDAGITGDLYGKSRDAAPSMGAAQSSNVCP